MTKSSSVSFSAHSTAHTRMCCRHIHLIANDIQRTHPNPYTRWSPSKFPIPSGNQAVTHPSTNRAQHCLTSVIGRELVCSMWYGRWREMMHMPYNKYLHCKGKISSCLRYYLRKWPQNKFCFQWRWKFTTCISFIAIITTITCISVKTKTKQFNSCLIVAIYRQNVRSTQWSSIGFL